MPPTSGLVWGNKALSRAIGPALCDKASSSGEKQATAKQQQLPETTPVGAACAGPPPPTGLRFVFIFGVPGLAWVWGIWRIGAPGLTPALKWV